MSAAQSATALLKVVAALAPLMGNREVSESMVNEIKQLFSAMNRAANAEEQIAIWLQRIDTSLAGIEEKLQGMQLPLSNGEVKKLTDQHRDMMPDLTKVRWNE